MNPQQAREHVESLMQYTTVIQSNLPYMATHNNSPVLIGSRKCIYFDFFHSFLDQKNIKLPFIFHKIESAL